MAILPLHPKVRLLTFLIRALRDADGANLDRVQVVKGWLDAKGETHEQIWDVAVSGDRKIEADGRCKTPVGNTVNVARCQLPKYHRRAHVTRLLEGS